MQAATQTVLWQNETRCNGYRRPEKTADEFIKLGQALKAAGLVDSGLDAKIVIQDGLVRVNGEVETRRGKKLYDGDVVEFDGETIRIVG